MLCSEDAAADKLPPPEPLDVQIGTQDALSPAGAISAVSEGMIVVQVGHLSSSCLPAQILLNQLYPHHDQAAGQAGWGVLAIGCTLNGRCLMLGCSVLSCRPSCDTKLQGKEIEKG